MTEYSMKDSFLSKNQDYIYARKYLEKYSTNYAFATFFMGKKAKRDTVIAYAFFRFVDEIVDNPEDTKEVSVKLNYIKEIWESDLFEEIDSFYRPIYAMRRLCARLNIPFSYVKYFINSMILDTTKSRYQNYQELEEYMYGSATVVGYIMMYITGYNNESTFLYAQKYAESMQLINFIRDIDEDLKQRNRIYIPKDFMDKFNVTEEMIVSRVINENIINLVSFLSEQSRSLMKEGRKGICFLNKNLQFSVFLAGRIYEYNLDILKSRNYNIFLPKIRINLWTKILIAIHSFFIFFNLCKKNKA